MRTLKLLTAIAIPAALAVLAMPAAHAAQPAYPEKPIRFVIGSAPGSGPDIIARALADRLYGAWGQRIVVDARPGVAGILSADLVLRSAADGYTWMMLTSQLHVATAVYPNVKFDLEKDFASISLIGTVPFVLAVNPELPAKSIRELIELAKKTPGAIQYGSAGTGATEHLSAVLFTRMTGTNMLHVPYKGIAEALAATMGNEVHFTYAVLPAARSIVQSGRVRALAVTSRKRAAMLPDVPTISETVPGYETLGWYSVVAQTGTPPAILAKVSAEIVKAVKEPQFGELLKSLGLEIVGSSRAELDAFRRDQTKRIAELVQASGVNVK